MGRKGLPAEGGVVLHEGPVARDVGQCDAICRWDSLAARVGKRPVPVRAVDDVWRGWGLMSLPVISCFSFRLLLILGFVFYLSGSDYDLSGNTLRSRIVKDLINHINYLPRPFCDLPTTKPGSANSIISIKETERV